MILDRRVVKFNIKIDRLGSLIGAELSFVF